ncbi:MAG: hypothetical protein J1F01_00470 [Oscillospiraceae bacterium]|nr:hypothetical protein [Oscillospiraceae bacterium]
MDCEKFREYLDNYENLTDSEKLEMTLHTEQCEECGKELQFMLSIIETTKSLPRIEPPADFMDKLNIRISMEERRNNRAAKRIMKNLKTNWKQYTAAAACFALVAVIVANGRTLIDNMDTGDDGIIIEETVSTDSPIPAITSAPVSIPVPAPDQVKDNTAAADNRVQENKETRDTQNVKNSQPGRTNKNTSSDRASSVANSANTASRQSVSSPSVNKDVNKTENNISAPVATSASESTVNDSPAVINNNTPSDTDNEPVIASVPIGRSIPEPVQGDITRSYSLESENGIAVASLEGEAPEVENIAVGKLRISSDNEEKAMSVIERYSYNMDDEMYAVNAENFAVMLSSLNMENVKYDDYTIISGGIVRFKVDLME